MKCIRLRICLLTLSYLFPLGLGCIGTAEQNDGRPNGSPGKSGVGPGKVKNNQVANNAAQNPRQQWPRFRGVGGLGVARFKNVPTEWDEKTGKNIRWKTPIPLPGKSSPILWAGRIFITGATKKDREVYCFDADSGKILWTRKVGEIPRRGKEIDEIMSATGWAAPTPVTDGRHVAAIFPNGDVVCCDFNGKLVWAKNLGTPENNYGHAASLVLYRKKLLIQLDQGMEEDDKSLLIALNIATGKEIYREPRKDINESWTTPVIIKTPQGDQLITCANPFVIAYNPQDGKEIWRVECLEGDGAPSPIYADGKVLAVNVGSMLAAIKPDGKGNVTQTHLLWKIEEDLPDICSPVSDSKRVFFLDSEGLITCVDIQEGKTIWTKDFESMHNASPSLVEDRVYVTNTKGVTTIFEASSKQYHKIGQGSVSDLCDACLAFAPGRIYLRSHKNLYCIENAQGPKKEQP